MHFTKKQNNGFFFFSYDTLSFFLFPTGPDVEIGTNRVFSHLTNLQDSKLVK